GDAHLRDGALLDAAGALARDQGSPRHPGGLDAGRRPAVGADARDEPGPRAPAARPPYLCGGRSVRPAGRRLRARRRRARARAHSAGGLGEERGGAGSAHSIDQERPLGNARRLARLLSATAILAQAAVGCRRAPAPAPAPAAPARVTI